MRDLYAWQQEFRTKTIVVWGTFDSEWNLSNLYESKEAAQMEVDFCKGARLRISRINVHTDKLARERWGRVRESGERVE